MSLHTLRSVRGQSPKLSAKRPTVIAIDSSGVKVYGEGEWKVKIHGQSKRRKWLKVHIAMDPQILEVTTASSCADSRAAEPLVARLPSSVQDVLAEVISSGNASKTRGLHPKFLPLKMGVSAIEIL
ncbi:MAG: transposase [Chlamydiales bacterium]|nr:transposase [Chlamydiales bacterium]